MAGSARGALLFQTGDYFSAYDSLHDPLTIREYGSGGGVIGSLTVSVPGAFAQVQGIAFGPDGLLYATVTSQTIGLTVLALDRFGTVRQTYNAPDFSSFSNTSGGKLSVDSQHIYVSANTRLVRFDLGQSASGQVIYTNSEVDDTALEPNGDLFVAWQSGIDEITSTGTILRSFTRSFSDPNVPLYTDLRGLAYDPSSNDLFVTMLGESDMPFAIMRVSATTGALESWRSFNYADDIFLTSSHQLLVGSDTQPVTLFTTGLARIESVGGAPQQSFVTQKTVPEPAALALALLAGLALARRR
ncbi:MAG TPA: hypothetical protein VMR31_16580 [Myxococcota bacterium]|nr:hypothetical protein [Myxococcota bacterium]